MKALSGLLWIERRWIQNWSLTSPHTAFKVSFCLVECAKNQLRKPQTRPPLRQLQPDGNTECNFKWGQNSLLNARCSWCFSTVLGTCHSPSLPSIPQCTLSRPQFHGCPLEHLDSVLGLSIIHSAFSYKRRVWAANPYPAFSSQTGKWGLWGGRGQHRFYKILTKEETDQAWISHLQQS